MQGETNSFIIFRRLNTIETSWVHVAQRSGKSWTWSTACMAWNKCIQGDLNTCDLLHVDPQDNHFGVRVRATLMLPTTHHSDWLPQVSVNNHSIWILLLKPYSIQSKAGYKQSGDNPIVLSLQLALIYLEIASLSLELAPSYLEIALFSLEMAPNNPVIALLYSYIQYWACSK